MNKENLSSIILTDRRSKSQEFFINLFEYCNMSCSFCWQDHDDWTGIESIEDKADVIFAAMERSGAGDFTVNLMGGELFCDDVDDKYFTSYEKLVVRLHEKVSQRGFEMSINWVTNLVFSAKRLFRVMQLVRFTRTFCQCWLTTSYDPAGRFNTENRGIFIGNLRIAGDSYIKTISVVMHAPNIHAFLKGPDPVLSRVSRSIDIFFDHYSPEHNAEKLVPKDSELLAMFKYLVEYFPHTQPAGDWISKRQQSLSCRSSRIIGPDGDMGQCGSLVPEKLLDSFETEIDIESNAKMEDKFLETNECLTCEYYHSCGLSCFLLHNYKDRRDVDECIYKSIYKYCESR